MKNIVVVFGIAILSGCTNQSNNEQVKSPDPEQQVTNNSGVKDFTSNEAKDFASELLKKINNDEKFVLNAVKLNQPEELERYFYDLQAYKQPDQKNPTISYWPDSKMLSPYLKCDTALGDLQLYASALSNQLKDNTSVNRKISMQEENDYKNSKAICEKRVSLSYEEAKTAYELE